MHITHYDLFAGIGGFSLALEEIFDDATIRHIFCEWESFPTAVLRHHWPDGEFYGDIADLVKHTDDTGLEKPRPAGQQADAAEAGTRMDDRPERPSEHADTDTQHEGLEGSSDQGTGHTGLVSGEGADQAPDGFTIVTGGFPCQPFSHAGRRKGTADDRYQWPNMFAVIRNTKPEWVIAENVRGLVTWNDGMVLETVCADLESEGYEVQPFIIPAVAVGAPHRRDRVWIIGRNSAYAHGFGIGNGLSEVQSTDGEVPQRHDHAEPGDTGRQYPDWNRNWQEVAFSTCDDSVDDGLRGRLVQLPDGTTLSYPKWRQNALKAFGNGIVPQVAMEIMQAIKESL